MPFVCFSTNPQSLFNLYCFPYAGAGATAYRDWKKFLPHAEVHALQLPGREDRFNETFIRQIEVLIEHLMEILPFLHQKKDAIDHKPFIFFGHSLGALIAFELTRKLQTENYPIPSLLILSGARAPKAKRLVRNVYQFSDEHLLEEMKNLGGVAPEFLQRPEILKEFFPILRADLEMAETYQSKKMTLLNVPILALGGEDDSEVSAEELNSWEKETTMSFESKFFKGGHFFIHSCREEVLSFISGRINALIPIKANAPFDKR